MSQATFVRSDNDGKPITQKAWSNQVDYPGYESTSLEINGVPFEMRANSKWGPRSEYYNASIGGWAGESGWVVEHDNDSRFSCDHDNGMCSWVSE